MYSIGTYFVQIILFGNISDSSVFIWVFNIRDILRTDWHDKEQNAGRLLEDSFIQQLVKCNIIYETRMSSPEATLIWRDDSYVYPTDLRTIMSEATHANDRRATRHHGLGPIG